jgi:putative restriction endonuclease
VAKRIWRNSARTGFEVWGLVEKLDGEYRLTQDGHQFVSDAIYEWAESNWSSTSSDAGEWATTYETTAQARAVDPEFRETVLSRYESTCPVSGVDHPGLLDIAHVLSWSEYPNHRADLENVLALSKTHHAAFDRELFTIDCDRILRVNPAFETESKLLQRTILDRAGEQVLAADGGVDTAYLDQRNRSLDWV